MPSQLFNMESFVSSLHGICVEILSSNDFPQTALAFWMKRQGRRGIMMRPRPG